MKTATRRRRAYLGGSYSDDETRTADRAKDTCNLPALLDRMLTPAQVAAVWGVRRAMREEIDDLAVCARVSEELAAAFGLELFFGTVDVSRGQVCHFHAWCRFPDGTILDATADQFGLDGVLLVRPHDRRYAAYAGERHKQQPA